MQVTAQQAQRAADGAPIQYERHRPEQTTLYRLVQQHAASFIAHTEASTGAELPRFDMQHCPNCGAGELKIIAAILERPLIEKILTHLGSWPAPSHSPPGEVARRRCLLQSASRRNPLLLPSPLLCAGRPALRPER